MKVILYNKNIVIRVVTESDSDYDYHNDRGEGVTVANNVSVAAGNYVDVNVSPMLIREATKQDYVDCWGSLSLVPGSILKPFFLGLDITSETDDVQTAIANIPNGDVDFLDNDCFIYDLSDSLKALLFNSFGIIGFTEAYNASTQYHPTE
jgi:hypothetical protein